MTPRQPDEPEQGGPSRQPDEPGPARDDPQPPIFGPPPGPSPGLPPVPHGTRPVFGPPKRELNLTQRYSRWAMWGCITVALVGLLFGGGLLLVALQQPDSGKWLAYLENLATCQQHMNEVSGALQRYHDDRDRMPARLENLYPTYMARRENLYCPADPKAQPAAPSASDGAARRSSYVYRPRVPWTGGREVLVFCPHHRLPRWNREGAQVPTAATETRQQVPAIRQGGVVDILTGLPEEARQDGSAGSAPPPSSPPSAPATSPAPASAPTSRR